MPRMLAVSSLLLACACGDDPPSRAPAKQTPAVECAPGESTRQDGTCAAAGVDACAPGFVADEGACVAILPEAACAPGAIAVPGDTICREIAPCGRGPWPEDLPDGASIQFVDAAFAGSSDGSASRPWRTVQEGVDAAGPADIVAIAQGTYVEDVAIEDKPVRLWGRCPALVEIVGSDADAAISIVASPGSEVRRLSVTGPQKGATVADSTGVSLVELWIHDTKYWGVGATGTAEVVLRGVLIERAQAVGVFARGGAVAVEGTAIRETLALSVDDKFGWGAAVTEEDGDRGALSLSGSLVERSLDLGVASFGADLTMTASVVRDTLPGIASADRGWGVAGQPTPGQRPAVAIATSVIERSRGIGLSAFGADVALQGSVVRDIEPSASDGSRGWGVSVQVGDGEIPSVEMRSCLVTRARDVGIAAFGAVLSLDAVRVDDTRAGDALGAGRGLNIQDDVSTQRSVATIRDSAVLRSVELGVLVYASEAHLDHSLVAATQPNGAAAFGDGLAVFSDASDGMAVVTRARIEQSARAGVSSFAGTVAISQTRLECNAIDLDAETIGDRPPSFDDQGGNTCGCDGAEQTCAVVSSALEPPSPIAP